MNEPIIIVYTSHLFSPKNSGSIQNPLKSEGWWNGHRKDLPWLHIFKHRNCWTAPIFWRLIVQELYGKRYPSYTAWIHPNLILWYIYKGVINQIFHVIQECYSLHNQTVAAHLYSKLTFILQHLISFSCPGYGVYIRQVFKLLRVVAYERVWIVNRRQWNN